MFQEIAIRGITFRPALFCAPLAGITHSAFRRLAAEFGGCGGFWTEMLSAKQILREDLQRSPYLRRSPKEARLIYQLMICEADILDRVIGRLSELEPDGIDINLACHAPVIRHLDAGSRLFQNPEALARVLDVVRRAWPGLLTVKIRLGSEAAGWEDRFAERLRLFDAGGVDAVVLHPRFFEDKFKRRARHELLGWAASLTTLPLIASGDITGPEVIRRHPGRFANARGIMIGRMAAARPWVFAGWDQPLQIDYAEVWRRMCSYIGEDFPTEQAINRIRVFTKYYARNFVFGHDFHAAIHNAPTIEAARARADEFFGRGPAVHDEPSLMGI